MTAEAVLNFAFYDGAKLAPPASVDASAAPEGRAAHIFAAMQDRHVPITPVLAAALAEMESCDSPEEIVPWGRAYTLSGAVIGLTSRLGFAKTWREIGGEFSQIVAEPVLRAAARQVGAIGFAHPARPAAKLVVQSDYRDYCAEIERAVTQLLTSPSPMGERFWRQAALRLLAAMRHRPAAERGAEYGADGQAGQLAPPPMLDPLAVELVYGVEPVFTVSGVRHAQRNTTITKSQSRRAGPRPREGGVEGIIHTSRFDDISDAVLTSFALPPSVRLLKFIEEGFTITDRPPLRRPDRDLLSVAYCISDAALDSAQLFKAAWIDATLRLRLQMATLRMTKSELVWTEARPLAPKAVALSVADSTPPRNLDPFKLSGAIRAHHLSNSALVPDIFDQRSSFVASDWNATDENAVQSTAIFEHMSTAAMDAIRRNALASQASARPTHGKLPNAQDYARVFALACIAGRGEGEHAERLDWADTRKNLALALERDGISGMHCAAVFLPETTTPGASFHLISDSRQRESEVLIPEDGPLTEAIAKTIGALSLWLITQSLEALHGV